MLDPNSN